MSFTKPIDFGTKFEISEWPLHITLADVFAIDQKGSNIVIQITDLLENQSPITVRVTDDAVLSQTRVVLVENSKDLLALHNNLVDLFEANGAIFNSPEFIHEGFLPHCTIQNAERLNKGDKIRIDTVTLIDMFPDGNWRQRKALSSLKLSGLAY